jgi:predicted nucleic acid-binding protein
MKFAMVLDETHFLIDANVCIGYVNRDDALYAQAHQAISHIRKGDFSVFILDHVIQEVLTVLLYRNKPELVKHFMDFIDNDPTIHAIDSPINWIRDSIKLASKQLFQPKMSLIDWLLLSRSLSTGIPLLTFDKQLLNAHKKLT